MKKRGIIISLVGIILISYLLIILINKNTKQYIMQDGVMLALTLDGNSITSLPIGNVYHVDVECNTGIGKYQPVRTLDADGLETNSYEMKFTIEDIAYSPVKCNLDFITLTDNNKTNYLVTNIVESKGTKISSTNNNGNTDISYRYTGKQPNNWVWYNNELWRIIGSIPTCMDSSCTTQTNLVKIMRAESIGGLAYHSSNTNTTWGGTGNDDANTLYTLLNSYYYGKKDATYSSTFTSTPCLGYGTNAYALCNYTNGGISNDSSDYYEKMMISVYMNAGSLGPSVYIDYAYTKETATLTSSATKIGLMTASDYGYATSDIDYSNVYLNDLSNYEQNNWIYGKSDEQTMSPNNTTRLIYVTDYGKITYGSTSSGRTVRPVIYLDSTVYIISGEGTESNPYILGM